MRTSRLFGTNTMATALSLAGNQKFHLYLLDTRLPDGSASTCAKSCGGGCSHAVVFFSAAAYERDKKLALDSGAQDYVTKPTANRNLCDVITRLILIRKSPPAFEPGNMSRQTAVKYCSSQSRSRSTPYPGNYCDSQSQHQPKLPVRIKGAFESILNSWRGLRSSPARSQA